MDPFGSGFSVNVVLQHSKLLRKIHHCNIDLGIFAHGFQSETACISANVENCSCRERKNVWQSLFK